jgi:glycosyltransferase A (GT-A) superfamily protein (DUF2064 family)
MRSAKATAILFFSRSSLIEADHKTLLKGKGRTLNLELTKALERRTLQSAGQSGLPIFRLDEQQQIGNTFGERIANAFEDIFLRGYSSVICIGNDAANLTHVQWGSLSTRLFEGDNILGPDFRNGAYLIGLTRQSFNKEQFQNLRWQTKYLLSDLKSFCKDYQEIEQVHDLNHWDDVKVVSRSCAAIRKLLTSICRAQYIPDIHVMHTSIDRRGTTGLRAPPQLHLV